MRDLARLISEGKAEGISKKFQATMILVVGGEEGCAVSVDDADSLEKLTEAVNAAGEPIAMIGLGRDPLGRQTVFTTILKEYEGERWAEDAVGEANKQFKSLQTKMGYPGWKDGADPNSN